MLEIGTESHPSPHPKAIFLLMYKGSVLTIEKEGTLAFQHTINDFQPDIKTSAIYCGKWHQQDVFVCVLNSIPKGFTDIPLRELLLAQDKKNYTLLSRARQLATWDIDHKFCARCGQALINKHDKEHTKVCTKCNQRSYPRISPCIIVSIRKGNQILLARGVATNTHFANIAGFVEAGETLEQTVIREVQEEVGITVKNIRYHSSQPWSFPHQLMVGFFADYEAGQITPAPGEIAEAAWFDINNLPNISPSTTISGQLIRQHIELITQQT